jgi:hypothetical protein
VHAIVLPETAIRIELANAVADILAEKTGLDLLVTGVLSGEDRGRNLGACPDRYRDGQFVAG